MLKKIVMALLIAAASFNLGNVTEAAEYDTENYHCGNYSDHDCYNYEENYNHRNYHGGHGCHR